MVFKAWYIFGCAAILHLLHGDDQNYKWNRHDKIRVPAIFSKVISHMGNGLQLVLHNSEPATDDWPIIRHQNIS